MGLLCNVIWNTILRSGLFSAHTFYWSKADLPNMHSGRIWQECTHTHTHAHTDKHAHTHTHTHTHRADTWLGYSNQTGAKFDLWGKVSGLPSPSSSADSTWKRSVTLTHKELICFLAEFTMSHLSKVFFALCLFLSLLLFAYSVDVTVGAQSSDKNCHYFIL